MPEIFMNLKGYFPSFLHQPLKNIYQTAVSYIFLVRSYINRYLLYRILLKKSDKLHLGCGDIRLKGFINTDYRPTCAADLVQDCTDLKNFPHKHFSLIYSHAFFEHIYRNKRIGLLTDLRRILKEDGRIIFAGIPDFETIARAYLEKKPGIIGETFDLYNVYRYTHGDPEQYPHWWIGQLHKSLFDAREIRLLLGESGLKNCCIFRYSFDREKNPLNLGFIAANNPNDKYSLKEVKELLSQLNRKINLSTIDILSINQE